MTASLQALRPALERALAHLPPAEQLALPDAPTLLDRARARITRDLLPRLEAEHPTLLVGIAGPNNVGKSSLFNSLVGAHLSPARPEGGLTKQCFAAAHPTVLHGVREVLERRYEIVPAPPDSAPPITEPGPPGRLYLALTESLPPGLLVMDTPDFDSVYRENRRAAEALLVTVDVVLFVVSRHTYQNAALVDFLREAVGHGRPYALVYNEATRLEIAREHLERLVEQVGHPAVARYVALHQPEVEAGTALLATEPLEGTPLPELLRTPAEVTRLKARALRASLEDARDELETIGSAAATSAAEPERVRTRLRRELRAVGERAAGLAIPADVLIEAFRDELDARSVGHRWLRKGPRIVSAAVLRLSRFVREQLVGKDVPTVPVRLQVNEALNDGVREVVEAFAPEINAWRGEARTLEEMKRAFGATTLERLGPPPPQAEEESVADRAELYRFCRELLSREMKGGATEQLQQLGATIGYAVPALVGVVGAVTVPGLTGGADVVFASTLLTTPLLERFVDQLGAGVRDQVAQSWRKSHGATLARQMESAHFTALLAHLDARVVQAELAARELREAAMTLRAFQEEVG